MRRHSTSPPWDTRKNKRSGTGYAAGAGSGIYAVETMAISVGGAGIGGIAAVPERCAAVV
jgi:hypothetical protein